MSRIQANPAEVAEATTTYSFIDVSHLDRPSSITRFGQLQTFSTGSFGSLIRKLLHYESSVGVEGQTPDVLEKAYTALEDYQHFLESCAARADRMKNDTQHLQALYSEGFQADSFDENSVWRMEFARIILECQLNRTLLLRAKKDLARAERNVRSAQGYDGVNAAWGGFPTPEMATIRTIYQKQLAHTFQSLYKGSDELNDSFRTMSEISRWLHG